MKNIFLFVLCFQSFVSVAQNRYFSNDIPTSLKSRANAIVREEVNNIEMLSPDNVVQTVKKAITVMNANGENHARLILHYDKSTVIKSIKGEVYNDLGGLIGKFNQNNFKDESAVQGFSLFEDSRVKHYLPSVNNFPYTIVYEYEIRHKQNLIIPSWIPKRANDVALEKCVYNFICKPNDQFKIDAKNVPSFEESSNENTKRLTWTLNNVSANKTELYSPNLYDYYPSVKIAPEKFYYYGKSGTYANWQELGKWVYDDLVKDRQELPVTTVDKIKEVTKTVTSPKEKAKLIYNYLQEKTRYISVQIGIGGFQPFRADYVDKTGYGDCKALVNYMQSLLKIVDIPSYYCVVEAGSERESLKPNFASMEQGNHIILCVPFENDTTWLECTSQKIPFGYLGNFTDDRWVLACTADGGKLLKTPKYNAEVSKQLRTAQIILDENGNAKGKLNTDFSGSQYENHEFIIYEADSEKEKSLKKAYDIDNINFEKISYKQNKMDSPLISEELDISVNKFGTFNNGKFYFIPNAFNQNSSVSQVTERQFPIELTRGYTDVDSIEYTLPKNVLPLLQNIEKNLETKFGSYEMSIKIKEDKLYYIRKIVLNDGLYPASDFEKFSDFMNEIAQQDRLKLVLNLKK